MDVIAALRERIEQLAPENTMDVAAAITLADAGYSLAAGFSQVLNLTVPRDLPERQELSARCHALCQAWIPRVDLPTLRQLEQRAKERKTPLDLAVRKAQLKKPSKRGDHAAELAAYAELPPVPGFQPLEACWIDSQLGIGERGREIKVKATPGVWLGYLHEPSDEELDAMTDDEQDAAVSTVIAVHANAVARIESLRGQLTKARPRLSIHGGRMTITDAGVAKDEDFQEALADNEPEAQLRGNCIRYFPGGDGSAEAHIAREGDLAILVVVEVR